MIKALIFLAALTSTFADAATLPAPAGSLPALMATAAPGDALKLGDGDNGDVYIRGGTKTYSPPLTIDACGTKATFKSLRIDGRGGLILKCLVFNGGGLMLLNDHNAVVSDLLATNPVANAIAVNNSTDVAISDVEVNDSAGDGIDIAGSQRVTIDRLACYYFHVLNGKHPDCIQLYANLQWPNALATITVRHVYGIGDMQGATMFGNLVPATDIIFDDVNFMTRWPQGVEMQNCTMTATDLPCAPTNSKVEYLRGALHIIQMVPSSLGDGNSGNSARP